MKATKTVWNQIDEPISDINEPTSVVTTESIEIRGFKKDKISFEAGKYTYIDLSESMFNDMVANNVICYRSTVVRCRFKDCQLTGLQLPEGNFKHVIFENCRINLANFRNSRFEKCIFSNCDLSETDFAGSRFTNLLFESCQLPMVDFSNCQVKNLEFSNSSLTDIKGVAGIKGSTVSYQNLIELTPLLAAEFNLNVRDNE